MASEIPVMIDSASVRPVPSMNVAPLLHEVRHALSRLLETGEPTTIDLRAIPLAPGEDEQIRHQLGKGEVEIQLNALGPSTFNETSYPGVWWVEHRNNDDIITGLYIEITHVPSIVPPSSEDIAEGFKQLTQDLSDNPNENE